MAAAPGSQKVPIGRKKGVSSFADLNNIIIEFKLGEDATLDMGDRAFALRRKVKPIIFRYAADSEGQFRTTWCKLGIERRSRMAQELTRSTPWLTEFEDGWATDFIFNKILSQKAYDCRRLDRCERQQKLAISPNRKLGIEDSLKYLLRWSDQRSNLIYSSGVGNPAAVATSSALESPIANAAPLALVSTAPSLSRDTRAQSQDLPHNVHQSSSPAFKDVNPLGNKEIQQRKELLQKQGELQSKLDEGTSVTGLGQKSGRKVGRPPKNRRIDQEEEIHEEANRRKPSYVRKPSKRLQESMEAEQDAEASQRTKRAKGRQKQARRTRKMQAKASLDEIIRV